MKKLLLILLCLPMIGFGQNTTLTFDDIKNLSSKQEFQRLFIQKGYVRYIKNEKNVVAYSVQSPKETIAAFYLLDEENSGLMQFQFSLDFHKANNTFKSKTFENIKNQIIRECIFYELVEGSYDIIYYTCPSSKYVGVIGFYQEDQNNARITTQFKSQIKKNKQ